MIDLPWALHALARLLTANPDLSRPFSIRGAASRYPSPNCLSVQLYSGQLHDLARWAAALGVNTAQVSRYGDPDDDGKIRTGSVCLHVLGEAPTGRTSHPTVPVEVWCGVPQLDDGDLADGATLAHLDAMLAPLALAR